MIINSGPKTTEGIAKPFLATHNGAFHADEVTAVAVLSLLPKWKDATVVRSRNPEVLKEAEIVMDVGGEFDPERKRFDHHQHTFNSTFSDETKTPMSSAGLIWKYFGKEILAAMNVPEAMHTILYKKLYDSFFEPLDCLDNGGCLWESQSEVNEDKFRNLLSEEFSDAEKIEKVVRKFKSDLSEFVKIKLIERVLSRTDITSRVSTFNPSWLEEDETYDENGSFLKAVEYVRAEFTDRVTRYIEIVWPARALTQKAFDSRFELHSSGKIMLLEKSCPFLQHLYDIEKENNLDGEILFVIYPEFAPSTKYRVKTITVEGGGFKNRKDLPKALGGLREEDLENCGIPGVLFVHKGLFIGACKDLPCAKALAEKALE